jgi:hypothetical protein
MNNMPAILVEGRMEKLLVEALCPGSCVRIINCNGDEVSLEAIAKRVGTLARLEQKRFSPIIVLLDREGRAAESSKIKRELLALLRQENVAVPVIVGVPDRMIENWILADIETVARFIQIKTKPSTQPFEGTAGEARLKELLPETFTYVKTIHGVEWFKNCDSEIISQNSASFREFVSALADLKCKWLAQKKLPLNYSDPVKAKESGLE